MNTHSSNYRPQMHKMLFKLGLISFLLLLNSIPSQSAVSSIDLGSEWIKVAVVNLKPGQSPISIAINEMSKRKSPALVAFHANDRLIGEEAAGLVARYPNKVYSQVRDLIGKPFDYVKKFLDSYYLPFDVVEDSRGGVGIKIDDGVTVYSPEELTAMVLGYGMRLAEFHSKVMVKDAVVTVPPYFGQVERKGLLQAAELAGLNVLALVNEHSGAALQYGIDKDFSNGSRYVVFYDMGSSSTYAALVYFSAYNTKEYGKTVSVNQFQVKDVRWDPELGGQNMEMRLVEYFADEFNKQVGNGIDVRQFPKAMAKLKKQVKRTKEILSANTAAPISVESLLDDRDFRSTITRQKFEEMCEDLWERSIIPVKELLKHSGLKADEIYAFELIGGGTRVPKLQAKLQEFLGKSDVDRHLDADEATVLGASLHAANLSDGIKLNRKLGMIDGSMYGFMMDLDGPELVKDETTTQLLVPRLKKLPIKMYRSITHNKDFDVSLLYENENLLPPGVTSRTFAKYAVSGLADASEKYMSRNLSSPVKATLHFSLSRSGILSLDRADAVIEISEWVEVPKKNQTLNNTNASTPLNQTVEANSTNSAETSDVPNQDDLTTNLVNSTENNQNSVDLGTEKKLKKRTFRIPLKISEKSVGSVAPLSEDSLYDGKLRLDALDSKDADRRRTAELKNDLEGYIYATKEKLDYLDDLQKVSSSEQRQSFIEKLDEVQDWLYTDGEDASATQFQERLDQLKAIGDPIFFRYKELTARPEASETAKQYFSELQEIVSGWESKKPWISKEKIDQVLREADDLKKWLDDKEAEQQKLSASSTPAYTSQEVMDKLLDLKDKVSSTNRIPKPKPKVEKPTVKNNDSKQEETVEKPTESQTDESKSYSSSKDDNNDSKQQETVGESTEHDEL
ncbi:putative Heat shock protein 70 family [Helianthus annuus]|uniref:Putative heat shock protein 70 family n=1 Tax=Helianthus annuus TaxID=4232 RepID=A0A251UHX9_HELAN|nr:heat shock 70 kDa protein 17 [Helianthus annuus]KAJ0559747.1 putative Heat shock protein 70 family [Helianthus annuus]KAJ0572727.1 putative Heat shock protein 70 family [Helianthus annuus]KAJ0910908.1 putative Heat shock protein 70 family [Helianthus annuus]